MLVDPSVHRHFKPNRGYIFKLSTTSLKGSNKLNSLVTENVIETAVQLGGVS